MDKKEAAEGEEGGGERRAWAAARERGSRAAERQPAIANNVVGQVHLPLGSGLARDSPRLSNHRHGGIDAAVPGVAQEREAVAAMDTHVASAGPPREGGGGGDGAS